MKTTFLTILILATTTLTACSSTAYEPSSPQNNTPSARMANPASMNCIQNNGKLRTVRGKAGDTTYCDLPSGKSCEEWDMFRGNCPVKTVNVKRNFAEQSKEN